MNLKYVDMACSECDKSFVLVWYEKRGKGRKGLNATEASSWIKSNFLAIRNRTSEALKFCYYINIISMILHNVIHTTI